MIRRLKHWWRITKLIWRGEPVRSWRKLENGKYICDSDCGRWCLHGVCTCGLCHFFKFNPPYRHKIERDTISWRREGDTENTMRNVPFVRECEHGVCLNDDCEPCTKENEELIRMVFGDLN